MIGGFQSILVFSRQGAIPVVQTEQKTESNTADASEQQTARRVLLTSESESNTGGTNTNPWKSPEIVFSNMYLEGEDGWDIGTGGEGLSELLEVNIYMYTFYFFFEIKYHCKFENYNHCKYGCSKRKKNCMIIFLFIARNDR